MEALRQLFFDMIDLRIELKPDPWLRQQLSMAQFKTLLLLQRQPDGLRVGAVAEALGVSPNATTSILDHLDEAGLIARTRDPGDRRAARITLTAAGAGMLIELTTAGNDELLDHFRRLTLAELQALHLGMNALHRALQERLDEQAGPPTRSK